MRSTPVTFIFFLKLKKFMIEITRLHIWIVKVVLQNIVIENNLKIKEIKDNATNRD